MTQKDKINLERELTEEEQQLKDDCEYAQWEDSVENYYDNR